MPEETPDEPSENRYEPSLDEAVRWHGVQTPDELDHLEDDDVATYYLAKIAESQHQRDQQLELLKMLGVYGLMAYGIGALVDQLRNDFGGL